MDTSHRSVQWGHISFVEISFENIGNFEFDDQLNSDLVQWIIRLMWQKNQSNRSMAGSVTVGNHESGRVTVERLAQLRLETTKVAERP